MKKNLGAALIVVFLAFACGKPNDSKGQPDFGEIMPYPGFVGSDFHGEKNFATLINNYPQGKSVPTPWAGYWYPYKGNGTATGAYGGGVSPLGKYDSVRGTNAEGWEVANHGSKVPRIQGWWGHCNGWAAAAALYPEPKEEAVVNGVHFDRGDIKGLLTEAGMEADSDFYGTRVDFGNEYNTPKYTDTVPDQYFLVLATYIGRLKQGVLIDRFTGDQVWNQPVAGYRFEYPKPSDYLGADPQHPGVYRINLTSTLWWVRDDVTPYVETPDFQYASDGQVFDERVLKMELWVDGPIAFGPDGKITSSGNVILAREGDYFVGGAWRMGDGFFDDAWPDYMWVPYAFIKPVESANPEVDINWIRDHILVPGGKDDPDAHGRPIRPAPRPEPSPEPRPMPTPTHTIVPIPDPRPTH